MEQYTNPKIWGPHFWFILRCIVHNYPMVPNAEDKKHMENYFYELQYVLPCEKCKYTFKQHYNKFPINKYLSDKNKLVEWLDLMYEETNRSIMNNRVKIMDEYINTGEMAPLKQTFKTDSDKQLEQQIKNVKLQVNKSVTPLANNITQYNPNLGSVATTFEPKKYVINNDVPNFAKQANGKKSKYNNRKNVNVANNNNNYNINNQIIQQNVVSKTLNIKEKVLAVPIIEIKKENNIVPLNTQKNLGIQQKQQQIFTPVVELKPALPPKTNIAKKPVSDVKPKTKTSIPLYKPKLPENYTVNDVKPYSGYQPLTKSKNTTYSTLTVTSKCKSCKQ